MSLIDIGANLAAEDFNHDLAAVLQRAQQAAVTQIIITGSSLASNAKAAQICAEFNQPNTWLYSTVGVHPHEASSWNAELAAQLKQQFTLPSVVAAGECGLDFNRNFSPRPTQEKAFIQQLQLAIEAKLPIFLHERDASAMMLAILRDYRDYFNQAIIHCFTGDKAQLYAYLDLDLYIGITGWLCDERRGQHLHPIVKDIPAGRLMIESDAPYLLPRSLQPKPRSRRNEPAYLTEVARTLAQCRHESLEYTTEHTTAAALNFFNLNHASAGLTDLNQSLKG